MDCGGRACSSRAGFACLVVMCMLVIIPPPVSAITCGQVASFIGPCLPYVVSGTPITSGCCNGVRSLNGAARTTPDRRTACNCLKSFPITSGATLQRASQIPGKCGVNIPYKISPNTDCSKVT